MSSPGTNRSLGLITGQSEKLTPSYSCEMSQFSEFTFPSTSIAFALNNAALKSRAVPAKNLAAGQKGENQDLVLILPHKKNYCFSNRYRLIGISTYMQTLSPSFNRWRSQSSARVIFAFACLKTVAAILVAPERKFQIEVRYSIPSMTNTKRSLGFGKWLRTLLWYDTMAIALGLVTILLIWKSKHSNQFDLSNGKGRPLNLPL